MTDAISRSQAIKELRELRDRTKTSVQPAIDVLESLASLPVVPQPLTKEKIDALILGKFSPPRTNGPNEYFVSHDRNQRRIGAEWLRDALLESSDAPVVAPPEGEVEKWRGAFRGAVSAAAIYRKERDAARAEIESLAAPVVAPEGVCDVHPFEHRENQYRVTTCNFTHNTYEFECRNWRELPSAPVVAPEPTTNEKYLLAVIDEAKKACSQGFSTAYVYNLLTLDIESMTPWERNE
jgi:hypothetical protein